MVAPSLNIWAAIRSLGEDRTEERLRNNLTLNETTGCWERPPHAKGYNLLKLGTQKNYLAHRVAWALANRANPGQLLVCHRCDNRCCVNPDHLFLGTPLDNTRDMAAKGRRAKQNAPRKWTKGPKLTVEVAAEIRRSSLSFQEIADRYGISASYARDVRRGRCWTDEGRAFLRKQRRGDVSNLSHYGTLNTRMGEQDHA